MSPLPADLTRRQIEAFAAAGAALDERSDRRDVEAALRVGSCAWDLLCRLDEDLSLAELTGDAEPLEFDELFDELFAAWLAASDPVEPHLTRLESDGCELTGAAAFRSARVESRGVLTPDDEFFVGEKLQALEAAALRAHREGRTEPMTMESFDRADEVDG